MKVNNHVEAITSQAAGAAGSVATIVSASSVKWIENVDPYMAFASECIAILVGLCTLAWYAWKFFGDSD